MISNGIIDRIRVNATIKTNKIRWLQYCTEWLVLSARTMARYPLQLSCQASISGETNNKYMNRAKCHATETLYVCLPCARFERDKNVEPQPRTSFYFRLWMQCCVWQCRFTHLSLCPSAFAPLMHFHFMHPPPLPLWTITACRVCGVRFYYYFIFISVYILYYIVI